MGYYEISSKKSWLQQQNFSVRFNLFLIPAYVIMLLKYWSYEDMSMFMKICYAVGMPILAMAGSLLLFSVGAAIFSREDTPVDTITVQICSFCVAYAFSISAACGLLFAEDRADLRDEMIDRAAQRLKDNGRNLTFKELKAALREIEKNDRLK